jgi:hypothetical protein
MVEVTSAACAGVECVREAAWQTLTVLAGPWFVIPVMLVAVGLGIPLWLMKVAFNQSNDAKE